MTAAEHLAEFVRRGLEAGQSRDDLRLAMTRAGWTESESATALAAWAEGDFIPPVPRPRAYVSAREALTYALLFMSLATVAFQTVSLIWNLIDYALPAVTPRDYFYAGAMRWQIASLLVFGPVWLWLTRLVQRQRRHGTAVRRSIVRQIFAALTLLIAAMVLLGDAVVVVNALLSGDMTLKFLLRALVVAVVGLLVVGYFQGELRDE